MTGKEREICEQLWIEHEPKLRSVCTAKMQSCLREVEDVISDVFVALCEQVENDGMPENPRAWLYGTLNNKIKLKFRDVYKVKDKETSLSAQEYRVPYENDLIEKTVEEVYENQIKDKLQDLLTEDEYKAIHAIHFEKLKMKEVAQIFGTTESAIKQKHYRICNKLRRIIKSSKNFL